MQYLFTFRIDPRAAKDFDRYTPKENRVTARNPGNI